MVLFDEVEKAHPDVFNTLLQVLEDGRLTDGQGRIVDFKNTVLILTTNLGTRDVSKAVGAWASQASNDAASNYERMKQKVNDELKQHFRPEFLNRIDDIIVFHQLTQDEIVEIVDLMIGAARRADAQQGHGSGAHRRRRRRCWPRRATTRCSVPGRCGAPSSARSRTRCREQILFGELKPGEIVVVDTEPENAEEPDGPKKFTFRGERKPDTVLEPPTAAVTAE